MPLRRLLAAAATLPLLAGCVTVRLDVTRTPSEAFQYPEQTPLGRAFAPHVLAHPRHSGFYVLDLGAEAFLARAAMAESADRSLDLQYYIMRDGQTTRLLTERLVNAAKRGVRVRILLDGLDAAGRDREIATLIAQPNIEVRLFNPFLGYGSSALSRLLEFLGDQARLNRRMHNKLWVADNAVAVVGGRNLGDEYFDATPDINFTDLDLLVAGPVVPQLSQSFDDYWNSDWAVPIAALGFSSFSRDEAELLGDAVEVHAADANNTEYGKRLASSNFGSMLRNATLPLFWAAAHAVYDKPGKIKVQELEDRATHIGPHLRDLRETARSELILISPYFIPSEAGRTLLGELCNRGVRVRILTNSLASTDVPVVHSGYARYRAELLRKGVELYELRPIAGASALHSTRLFGRSSEASLHAKAFIVDRELAFVGSMNLDPRSRHLNTELGVVIESPELASKLVEIFDEAFQPTMFSGCRSGIHNRRTTRWYGSRRKMAAKYAIRKSFSPVSGSAYGRVCCLSWHRKTSYEHVAVIARVKWALVEVRRRTLARVVGKLDHGQKDCAHSALRPFVEDESMTLKRISVIFGVVFVAVGVLGWIPALAPGGKLLGLFDVNAAHNLVHLATGVIAIVCGAASEKASRLFFQIFGVIYAVAAALGFFYGDQPLFGIVSNNRANSVLHVVRAVIALYLGFVMKSTEAPATSRHPTARERAPESSDL